MEYIDARGLACPEPVIRTKQALDRIGHGQVVTIVDNEVALNNVLRLATSRGLRTQVEEKEGEFRIHIYREDLKPEELIEQEASLIILVKSEFLGVGDEQLGSLLMKNFFYALSEAEFNPRAVIFLNTGVKLSSEGSPIISSLVRLEQRGTEILSCGTCLDYYGLKDKLCVGRVTNIYDVVEFVTTASKVVSI